MFVVRAKEQNKSEQKQEKIVCMQRCSSQDSQEVDMF